MYDIRDIKKPKLVSPVSAMPFASLHAMNLTQEDNFLYLAIGNHFNNKQASGMAIVDITDWVNPLLYKEFGGPNNNMGSRGAGIYKDKVFLSYTCAIIPFTSNRTGVKLLTYNDCY